MKDSLISLIRDFENWFHGYVIEKQQLDRLLDAIIYNTAATVCLIMTILNYNAQDYPLMTATLIMTVLDIFDLVVILKRPKSIEVIYHFFIIQLFAACAFFIISGNPEGFSAIWIAMVPAGIYARSNRKEATIICLIFFAMLVFLYWIPFGRSLLRYKYTEAWILRFPFFYVGVGLLSFLQNTLLSVAMKELTGLRGNLQKQVDKQTEELREKNEHLVQINENIVEAICEIVEGRDMESGTHVKRVKSYSRVLASAAQHVCPQYNLTDDAVDLISMASAAHDIGKIMISDTILLKPGKFTPEEFAEMKKHSEYGAQLMDKFSGVWGDEMDLTGRDICLYHHERWDGKGYPCGLKGDEIPVSAQIVALADVFDALTSERVYRPAIPYEKACEMIMNGECGAFSSDMLACFVKCREAMKTIHDEIDFPEAETAALKQKM